jgi:hypothetical protein
LEVLPSRELNGKRKYTQPFKKVKCKEADFIYSDYNVPETSTKPHMKIKLSQIEDDESIISIQPIPTPDNKVDCLFKISK